MSRARPATGTTAVSVPGKLILMGEHAVVYDRPAVVAAVNVRLRVTLSAPDDLPAGHVRLGLPGIGVEQVVSWDAIRRYAADARASWREFSRQPSADRFRPVRGTDPAHVPKIALGEASLSAGDESSPAMEVRIDSEIPIGAGFGSSASTAVGVVAGYLAHAGYPSDPQTIDRVALEVERRQHGLPSGVDHATVLRGGLIWAHRNPSGAVFMEPIVPVSTLRSRLRVFDTGTPREATGEVVAEVRERIGRARDGAGAVLDRMEDATRAFRHQHTVREEEPRAVLDTMREYQRCLVQLGVVPPAVREVVSQVERDGGAAKISGAGALTGDGAGCLLVYHPDPARIDTWEYLAPFDRVDVSFGAEGLRGELP